MFAFRSVDFHFTLPMGKRRRVELGERAGVLEAAEEQGVVVQLLGQLVGGREVGLRVQAAEDARQRVDDALGVLGDEVLGAVGGAQRAVPARGGAEGEGLWSAG